tara:strand:- start:227 stop:1024 length:798 start_codon:yes stop_codon:yes gene_type:complete
MLQKSLIILLSMFSLNVLAEGMPQDVEDMIKAMNGAPVTTGKARESLKISNPYANAKPVKKITNEEKLKKAKFNLDLKVISCLKDKLPDFLEEKSTKHDACGDLDAQVIFEDELDVYLTKESKFNNLKPSKIIRTIPEISKSGENYIIKDKQIINTVQLGTEVFVIPTTIIGRQVQLDLAVRTTELADINEVYLDSSDKNFVNNQVALKHRFLVASFPVDINQEDTLGGNSAILVPMTADFKAAKNYPETARLWLDVKLTLPKRG